MADLTFYPGEETLRGLGWTEPSTTTNTPPLAKDVLFSFQGDDSGKLQRGIICSCYAGRHHSVTARETGRVANTFTTASPPIPRPNTNGYIRRTELRRWPTDGAGAIEKKHRVENARIVRRIWHLVHASRVLPPGIIVVAGETGSRKTTFAREIARRHISNVMGGADRPHIVTYEDPIESWFAYKPDEASKSGFEYTPRQKGVDVSDLNGAVIDALRQKPALLYVNEVRTKSDWQALLFFAGTGHLAITTTHAGSLVETFGRILAAARADTSAKRSEIASRIVAVIHVKELDEQQLVPALWLQTARSRSAFTQDGLGSLLPARELGCYGRAYFAQQLGFPPNIFRAAMKSDLSGD